MYTHAIVNQKGGVGKTATSFNVAAALAAAGHRTLLIDWDPQGHLTRALGIPPTTPPATLANAVLGTWTGDIDDLVTAYRPNLDVIATNDDAFLLEPQMYGRPGREFLLSRFIDALASRYDYALIDCPPSLGALTDNALVASRRVLIPVQAEDTSLDALRLLFEQIRTLEAVFGLTVQTVGLVVNGYDARRGRVATSTLEAFRSIEGLDVLAVIGDRKEMREAWRLHQPVVEFASDSTPASWYRDLAAVLVNRATNEKVTA